MILLNKNHNASIILAGILALIVGVGVARFAFTSLLPSMLNDFMSVNFAGVLASINYMGYLGGALFAIFIKDINTKVKYFRFGMILCILTTLILATTKDETIWLISRTIAGFGSAMALVVGSAIVMTKLKMESKTKAMGIHFSGIGFSVLVSDLIMRAVLNANGSWENSWMALAVFAIFATIYSIYILSFDTQIENTNATHKFDIKIFTPFVIILIFAYFTEGIGYVVFATFLPDIINSIEALNGYGGLTWTLVGIAGIPSTIIWMRLADKYGSINMILIAMGIQIVGILIPATTENLYLNLLSGVFYGGTVMALVALFMNLGGEIAQKNPVILMGALTTAYGIGMVIAPLYSIKLIEKFHNYDIALAFTAIIVSLGLFSLLFMKILTKEKIKMKG